MVSHYCIVTLKAGSRRSRFDIAFVKSRPGPFVVPFNVSFGHWRCAHVFVNVCLCVYKRGRGAGYFYLHHRSLSASQPSDLGCSSLDLQCLTSMPHQLLTSASVTLMYTHFLCTISSIGKRKMWKMYVMSKPKV